MELSFPGAKVLRNESSSIHEFCNAWCLIAHRKCYSPCARALSVLCSVAVYRALVHVQLQVLSSSAIMFINTLLTLWTLSFQTLHVQTWNEWPTWQQWPPANEPPAMGASLATAYDATSQLENAIQIPSARCTCTWWIVDVHAQLRTVNIIIVF